MTWAQILRGSAKMNTNQIYSSISDDNLDNYLFWLPRARARLLSFDRSAKDCLLPSWLSVMTTTTTKGPKLSCWRREDRKKSLRGIARPDQQTTQSSTGTNEHHNRIKNLFESFLSIFSFPRHFAYGTGKWNRHTISLGATVVAVEPPSQNTVD